MEAIAEHAPDSTKWPLDVDLSAVFAPQRRPEPGEAPVAAPSCGSEWMDEYRMGMEVVARQRQAAAARVRLGWWFPVLSAVSWALAVGGDFPAAGYRRLGIPDLPYGQVGGLRFLALIAVFSVRSGMNRWDVSPFSLYPSLRRRFPAFVLMCLGSAAVVFGLSWLGGSSSNAAWAAVGVAVVAGGVMAFLLTWMAAGIRGDILTGGRRR
ncbi:hypothetical protein [Streptomyces sp. 769]|uniref:hypothetical protein n=1 Tax=Streptomyces sp. 769 TaxID=1262452 RepID=UPI00057E6AF8|nr:hypothetical protein [Streptomyces sp. 769]AJC60527.1 hypothetical protein GZL_07979 [Streptomyces sp. 769]